MNVQINVFARDACDHLGQPGRHHLRRGARRHSTQAMANVPGVFLYSPRTARCSAVDARVSSEIDVFITDTWTETPWLTEGSLIIAPPSCVLGQLHVKTEFDIDEYTDVLVSGARNQKIVTDSVSGEMPWFGAIFFAQTRAKSRSDSGKYSEKQSRRRKRWRLGWSHARAVSKLHCSRRWTGVLGRQENN
jgi:hypothetical protein